MRPADICSRLLAALDASDGRRRKRKRNTTPDAIGMAMKRTLLEETVRQDPDPDTYEQWLLERCLTSGEVSGSVRAMALEVFHDWQLAQTSAVFRSWLEHAAPSDDAAL
jgi:uncharacterized membrane protein YccC